MNRNKYRKLWLRMHRSYQKRIFRIFMRDIRRAANNIPFDSLDEQNYEAFIRLNIPENTFASSYFDSYLIVGMMHGRRVGYSINRQMKAFDIDVFATSWRRFLAQWLLENAGTNIVSVRESLVETLIKQIAVGLEEGKGIRVIAKELQKLVKSRGFYRWQALRIARTEATAAANLGATIAGRDTGVVLEKEWLSSNDPRTRRRPDDKYDHIEVDGQKVSENGKFNVQGDRILYPGDPKGQPGNIINCRCTTVLVPKRDLQGRLVFKQ
jgi:hypothetical protein